MDTNPDFSFPLVERYRAELQASDYARLSADDTMRMKHRFALSHHSNAIEDVHPSPKLFALFEMFVQERVPVSVAQGYVSRFMKDEDEPAAAQSNAA